MRAINTTRLVGVVPQQGIAPLRCFVGDLSELLARGETPR